MRFDAGGGPEHGAEAARIAQPQDAVAQRKVEVIVLARRRFRRQHAQAARHAQMQDQVPGAAIDDEVLAAPLDAAHRHAGQAEYLGGNRPAQPPFAHGHAGDDASRELRREAAARHFDLW
jgi:hypothetical protein